jgi:hypothetical protein
VSHLMMPGREARSPPSFTRRRRSASSPSMRCWRCSMVPAARRSRATPCLTRTARFIFAA